MSKIKSQNEMLARCYLQVAKALEMIGDQEAADYEKECAYEYAQSAGMKNEEVSLFFKSEPLLAKAYRDGVEDARMMAVIKFAAGRMEKKTCSA